MSAEDRKGKPDRSLRRELNTRVALVFFLMALILVVIGAIVNNARLELITFADIEHEQGHANDATTLLQVAGSYRNVVLSLWGFGVFCTAIAVAFLALASSRTGTP